MSDHPLPQHIREWFQNEIDRLRKTDQDKPKLYQITVNDDFEYEDVLVVAKNKEEAEIKVQQMEWGCLMALYTKEVSEVDGYKIILK